MDGPRWTELLLGSAIAVAALQPVGCHDCPPCEYDTRVFLVALDATFPPGTYSIRLVHDEATYECSAVFDAQGYEAPPVCDEGVEFMVESGDLEAWSMGFEFEGALEPPGLELTLLHDGATVLDREWVIPTQNQFVAPENLNVCEDEACDLGHYHRVIYLEPAKW